PKKLATSSTELPATRSTRTRGPPPISGVTTTSALPSPSTSPAATYTPPVKAGSNTVADVISPPVLPSNTTTTGGPPGPDPALTSATPSPFTSPVATRTSAGNGCDGVTADRPNLANPA